LEDVAIVVVVVVVVVTSLKIFWLTPMYQIPHKWPFSTLKGACEGSKLRRGTEGRQTVGPTIRANSKRREREKQQKNDSWYR